MEMSFSSTVSHGCRSSLYSSRSRGRKGVQTHWFTACNNYNSYVNWTVLAEECRVEDVELKDRHASDEIATTELFWVRRN